ncbi:hypothetical protein [Ligilactobacillus salivarius]|uniref:Uncharacterized protein n=1 Tax=Ligilactobacillus salivarius TaxID=1624 RepID=A0A1V9U145_9LACO|nr:hypothetical protein [Ligilactobacillus salivarius]EFK80713.1 hypothetical protein HMPREF9269_1047 [Ligilactobacillus salivarius ACS-116-V-Col5a]OQR21563.1 hypothetical protein B6U39_03845 [Ligilactobacillus salivarius]OQR23638.1 hypothetical protein B6U38_03875 [Ligilactobacillus salivarius]OQR25632.1 hypothetical protein B6U37_03860 [Ligilactobacillus salivarius]
MKIEQIKKNLLSKELNILNLSEETGLSRNVIYGLRKGERDFNNLTLKTIKSLEHYFEMRKPVFKFKLKDEVIALVVENDATNEPMEILTTYDDNVFLEEVAYNGNLLIISVTNKGERVRRYAIKTLELLKHAKVLTRKTSKEEWHEASVKEMQDAGLYIPTI